MKLSLSPRLRATLGLGPRPTADEVVSALSEHQASVRAANHEKDPVAVLMGLSDAQVHDLVFGSGALPAELTSAPAPAPANDGPAEADVDAWIASMLA